MSLITALDEAEVAALDSAARMVADRDELKYVVPSDQANELIDDLSRLLSPYRYHGAAPDTHAYATTVYFDTPHRELYRAAMTEPLHVKIRAREYYEVPIEGPHAERDALAGAASGVVWLELKARDGRRSRKRRACVPKHELPRWFAAFGPNGVESPFGEARDGGAAAIADELRRVSEELRGALVPSVVVNYRRLSWQDASDSLRVTLDRDVSAFAPPAEPWGDREVLSRERLGAPALEERCCVLEVKSRGALPSWVNDVLRTHGATEVQYSKFAVASRAVHGPL